MLCLFAFFIISLWVVAWQLGSHGFYGAVQLCLSATAAEVCFGLQLGLLVYQLGAAAEVPIVQTAAWGIPFFMLAAQFFCWHSVLTLNHFTQTVESFFWALGMSCMAALLTVVALYTTGTVPVGAGIAISVVFVAYVLSVDIPLYLRRFRANRLVGRKYLSLTQGARNAMDRREPSQSWSNWNDDAIWLTPYFSAGVWISVALTFAPV